MFSNTLEGGPRIEAGGWQQESRLVNHGSQKAKHQAEAVVQRRGTADDISRSQFHALAHQVGVVQNVAMRQAYGLRGGGCTGRELQIGQVLDAQLVLRWQSLAAVREDQGLIVGGDGECGGIDPTCGVVNEEQVLQRRDGGGEGAGIGTGRDLLQELAGQTRVFVR